MNFGSHLWICCVGVAALFDSFRAFASVSDALMRTRMRFRRWRWQMPRPGVTCQAAFPGQCPLVLRKSCWEVTASRARPWTPTSRSGFWMCLRSAVAARRLRHLRGLTEWFARNSGQGKRCAALCASSGRFILDFSVNVCRKCVAGQCSAQFVFVVQLRKIRLFKCGPRPHLVVFKTPLESG